VVNAAGAGIEALQGQMRTSLPKALRLVKGSHIVVPRLFTHDHAYAFQGRDQRLIFAMPFERDFTLIGTTDVPHPQGATQPQVEPEEVLYLCQEVSRYLRRPVQPGDVVWRYAGLRAVPEPGSSQAPDTPREHRMPSQQRPAPWLTVWGGQLTTFRQQAEQAADEVGRMLGDPRHHWTADAMLPGGTLTDLIDESSNPVADMAEFQSRLRRRHPWMDLGLMRRWTRAYGSRVLRLLDGVNGRSDLGLEIAPDLYEAELFYLKRHEWAMTADDVLWRRSKLGLHYSPEQREAVAEWFGAQAQAVKQGYHHSALSRSR